MADLVNMLMLICAGVAALGLGVVTAYLVFKMGFAALKIQSRPVASMPPAKAQIARVL